MLHTHGGALSGLKQQMGRLIGTHRVDLWDASERGDVRPENAASQKLADMGEGMIKAYGDYLRLSFWNLFFSPEGWRKSKHHTKTTRVVPPSIFRCSLPQNRGFRFVQVRDEWGF